MPAEPYFSHIPSEFDLRLQVQQEFFPHYHCSIEDNRVDFVVASNKQSLFQQSFLWAESKLGNLPLNTMFAQLLLTIKPLLNSGEILPPKFLGVFNKQQISFIEFHHILPIFNINDLNWEERPSSVSQKTVNIMAPYLINKINFQFSSESQELRTFILQNFIEERENTVKLQINKNNFISVYNKWVKAVFPSILIKNQDLIKKAGILEGDFFLADLLSSNGKTILQNLKIILNKTRYEIQVKVDLFNTIEFKDGMKAHADFWARYERPPKQEYHEYILTRRDLLVPQDIRERHGAFFTPQIWVEKAHEYLAKTLGENWQEEYYIWDCCAGTCNLLANLANPYRIWASTLDQPDINIVHELIDKQQLNLLKSHVFQFDFLNDDFEKLPQSLQDVLKNPSKRQKLVILINPPYAEATTAATVTGTGKNKPKVATNNKTYLKYKQMIGKASNEIFSLFLIRIYSEIPEAILAQFSTLKIVQGTNFTLFRDLFLAKFLKGFIAPADTFDNVKGKFPIGFTIWDLKTKEQIKTLQYDVFDRQGNFLDVKNFYGERPASINQWIKTKDLQTAPVLAFMGNPAPDFQNNKFLCLKSTKGTRHVNYFQFNKDNLIEGCIYFASRLCIPPTWINDRDQFLYPSSNKSRLLLEPNSLFEQEVEVFDYEKDKDFQNDCLIFTIFHSQNRIISKENINHWIPFSPAEVHAKDNFRSSFIYDYLQTRDSFTPAALEVINAGRLLWTYYHDTINTDALSIPLVDASLYEIRENFKGRDVKGHMNKKATDETFNQLYNNLQHTLKALALQIRSKIYEYGFLQE